MASFEVMAIPDRRSQTGSKPRLDYLDGVRALAAIWVMLSHIWLMQYTVLPGPTGWATNWLSGYNHFAVDVFIVLSGFCLALPVARTGDLPGGTLNFFKRRAWRILPPFFAALAFAAPIAIATQRFGHSRDIVVTNRVMLANLFLLQDVFPNLNSINGPLWSVALECKIYLFFPLLVLTQRRWGAGAVLVVAGAIGYGAWLLVRRLDPNFPFYHSCPWYLLLFAMGMISGSRAGFPLRAAAWKPAWICIALAGAALALQIWQYPIMSSGDSAFVSHLPFTDACVGVVVAAALYLGSYAPRARRALEWKSLVRIGTGSYSLYLIHMPCILLARILVNRVHLFESPSVVRLVVIAAVGLSMATIASYLFFLVFERPFLRSRAAEKRAELTADASFAPVQ